MNLVRKARRAFTLVELLLVLVIIGTLAALVVPSFAGKSEKARIKAAESQIKSNFGTALEMFREDCFRYPTTEEGLKALVEKPSDAKIEKRWGPEPYLKGGAVPVDPWGNPYKYEAEDPTKSYLIRSAGPDGQEGTEDDITSETKKKES